jgi:hypothetical protein
MPDAFTVCSGLKAGPSPHNKYRLHMSAIPADHKLVQTPELTNIYIEQAAGKDVCIGIGTGIYRISCNIGQKSPPVSPAASGSRFPWFLFCKRRNSPFCIYKSLMGASSSVEDGRGAEIPNIAVTEGISASSDNEKVLEQLKHIGHRHSLAFRRASGTSSELREQSRASLLDAGQAINL